LSFLKLNTDVRDSALSDFCFVVTSLIFLWPQMPATRALFSGPMMVDTLLHLIQQGEASGGGHFTWVLIALNYYRLCSQNLLSLVKLQLYGYSICCGFVAQHIRNKSNKWSSSFM